MDEKLKYIRLFFEILNLEGLYNQEIFQKLSKGKKFKGIFKYAKLYDYAVKFLNDKIVLQDFIKIGDINGKKDVLYKGFILEEYFTEFKPDYVYIIDEDFYRYFVKKRFSIETDNIYIYLNNKTIHKLNLIHF